MMESQAYGVCRLQWVDDYEICIPLQNSAQVLIGCCVPPTAFVLLVLQSHNVDAAGYTSSVIILLKFSSSQNVYVY